MKELSLFTGGGGGVLATQHLLGWETKGYVEIDGYCQEIIKQRIADGYLSDAPIFSDIRAFLEEGYADVYQGMVDVITAGFPCQPFSVAGKQAGADDERNMWPATIGVIRRVRPRFCLLENVPGLLSSGYMGQIFGDLAEGGYDAKWRVLSAAELGAPHKRDRLWISAIDSERKRGTRQRRETICGQRPLPWGENVRGIEDFDKRPDIPTPALCRVGDGVAYRVDRLRAIGNGQVPAVAAAAWEMLSG